MYPRGNICILELIPTGNQKLHAIDADDFRISFKLHSSSFKLFSQQHSVHYQLLNLAIVPKCIWTHKSIMNITSCAAPPRRTLNAKWRVEGWVRGCEGVHISHASLPRYEAILRTLKILIKFSCQYSSTCLPSTLTSCLNPASPFSFPAYPNS